MTILRSGDTDASPWATWRDLTIFWGKARPPAGRPSPSYHPLIFHSLDVAAVGEALLARWLDLAARLAAGLGLEVNAATALLIRLLALHDLGKFARRFQAKSPAHYDPSFGPIEHVTTDYDHASGGYSLLQSDPGLREGLPEWAGLARLAASVTGHHGSPPRELSDLRAIFHRHGTTAAHAFTGMLSALLPSPAPRLDRARTIRASFRLAGFAVLCDWIGSNEDWFHYQEPDAFESLAHYWDYARQQADRAVAEAGVIPAVSAPRRTFAELTGHGFEPSPMQRWAAEVALPEGPLLAVLEDETGSGKTEAALMLAHRLIASGRAESIYIALPTMATANAMFERLAASYRKLFANGADPSIALAHGRRDLVAAFREARLAGARTDDRYDNRPEDLTASGACAEWIADDRRRAFLADIGAGTIDQAALAVLPSRYQSLRLFGLGRSVLVVDEIHAYDDYVRELIVALLEFHASQGGSAILLSATVPAGIRADFVRAFARGAGGAGEDDPAPCYPRATLWSPATVGADPVCGRADRARAVPVRFLANGDDAIEAAAAAAGAGAAVLYLRNTVQDAHEAHRALEALGLTPMLFHSQFTLVDRLERERSILELFGPHSTAEQRRGRILVATQVAEQSLDIDFDLVISDLAPIDLIIQRAGRLWRHTRPDRPGAPELLVVSPDPVDEPDPDWYARLFRRGAFVYRHHGRLWLTARMLKQAAAIRSPEGLRELVEAVYGDAAVMPAGLEERSWTEEGREGAAAGFGRQNVLKVGNGYDRGGGLWATEERTPTRLVDEEQVTLRLARIEADEVVPWAPIEDADAHRAWRLSEVNIARRRISGEAVPPELSAAARRARAVWTRYDQEKVLVVLREEDGRWLGAVSSEDRGPREISYTKRSGLLATAAAPVDDEEWLAWWEVPPAPELLRERFAEFADAFVLDGDGARFMQDADALEGAVEVEAGGLLIDAPGENTVKKNADLFVKRGGVSVLSRATAAMALFTLQTYAPSGGQGHRTSLRGGGPLTTLAVAGRTGKPPNLWGRLWPNVETREAIDSRGIAGPKPGRERIFPWLAPTRTSNDKAEGRPTSPRDADPLQVYWGMPRRIRLLFEPAEGRVCDLTGTVDPVIVRAYRTRNHGVQYTEGFAHPLSPYRVDKKDPARRPWHQHGGISYRHWLGFVVTEADGQSTPAAAVNTAQVRATDFAAFDRLRLVAFGYDMDNMKARGWSQSEMPLPVENGKLDKEFLDGLVRKLIPAAATASRALIFRVKSALYRRPSDVPGDFGFIGERFWRETEAGFYETVRRAHALYLRNPHDIDAQRPELEAWVGILRRRALVLFDEYAPLTGIENRDMERLVRARWSLVMTFHGAGKQGEELYLALGLVSAKERKARRK